MLSSSKNKKPSLGNQLIRGSLWMIAMRWSMRLMGLVSTVILARLLTTNDFGIVAMAMIFLGFIDIFSDIGVDAAIVRHPAPTKDHYNNAWSMQLVIGIVLGLLLFFSAPLAAWYFDEPDLKSIVQWLALAPVLKGAENIGVVNFRRELNFVRDFQYNFGVRLLRFVFTVTLAFVLKNYWVLVIGIISQHTFKLILSYWMHPFRPTFSLTNIREFRSVSIWVVIKSIGEFFSSKLDQLLVGGLLGARDMGRFFMGSEIGKLMTYESVLPVGRALMPGYAQMQENQERLIAAYTKVTGMVSYISLAIGFGIAAVANDFTIVVLGEKWQDTATLIQTMAISWALVSISTATWPLLSAMGRWSQWALVTWLQVILIAIALWTVIDYRDIELIAEARLVASFLFLILALYLSFRALSRGIAEVVKVLFRPLICCLIMFTSINILHQEFEGIRILSLFFDCFVGAVVFISSAIILWLLSGCSDGPEKEIWTRLYHRTK